MTRLVDLFPSWLAAPERRGQGLTFACPCCVGSGRRVRLAILFANPLDGGKAMTLGSKDLRNILWPDGDGSRCVPPGTHWQRSGDTIDSLTLHPSVDASPAGHWHGWVTNGEVR